MKEMKQILKIALWLAVCIGLLACKKDNKETITGFNLSSSEIVIGADGGKDTLTITSEGEWTAKVAEPWVNVSPANGIGKTECIISIDAALKNEMRTAKIRFSPKGENARTLTVRQSGYEKSICVKESDVKIKASDLISKRYFETEVTSNISFDIEFEWLTEKEGKKLSDWVSVDKKSEPEFKIENSRPHVYKIRFNWDMNPEWTERQAIINFVPKNNADNDARTTPIIVTQEASPEITDDHAGDSLAVLTIYERLRSDINIDLSEKISYWKGVTLWERTDEDLPEKEAVGRVRSLSFSMINIKETIPPEVKYLKYLETFKLLGNENTMLLNIELKSDICELKHLKNLQIDGYGLVSLPEDFNRLGNTLESLDLSGNNFTHIPEVLTQENFPKLKRLVFGGNRRWLETDLSRTEHDKETGIGFYVNMDKTPNELDQLFLWDSLEELILSYNYIEGTLPTYETMPAWTQDDIKEQKDTLNYLVDNSIPKILPKAKRLAINLNFFTGKLPQWLLYHPKLLEWAPELMIFSQQETGLNSKGEIVKFSNAPANFEYYFNAFPLYRKKYEVEEE